jgi:hypothetical protein
MHLYDNFSVVGFWPGYLVGGTYELWDLQVIDLPRETRKEFVLGSKLVWFLDLLYYHWSAHL